MTARHAAPTPKRSAKKKAVLFSALGLCVAVAVAAVTVISTRPTSPATAVVTPHAQGAFAVLAATPSNNATVNSNASIRVALSGDLSASSPLPVISPSVAGTWQRLSSSTLEFVQQTPFQPGQAVTVTIPGGSGGLQSTSGKHLSATVTTSFQISDLSLLRVQQLLAEEGYLPVTFTPTSEDPMNGALTGDEIGTFSPRFSDMPASLMSLWQPGVDNVLTQGAIMRFQDDHHMQTDGDITDAFDAALLADRQSGTVDPNPYTYVSVSKTLPETLTLYSDGQVIYTTSVNTGIPGADTADGTFPVYARYVTTTMSGTNPDGTTYHDTGIPWVSYFNGGDALHGYIRSSYGFPQSLGCVEMPYSNAAVVWPHTPIGTLVTVV
jgi:lipoprotein-anchoring transpeptidase ErfK/SrfK